MSPLKIRSLGLAAILILLVLTAGCAYYSSNTNYQDIGVVRVDTEAVTLWDQTVDSGYGDYIYHVSTHSDLVSAPDGGVFVGYHLLNRPRSDPSMPMGWVTSLGPDGERRWDWSMDSDMPWAFAPAPDRGCVVLPETYSESRIVKIGPDGRTEWTVFTPAILNAFPEKKRPKAVSFSSIAPTTSGEYLAGGGSILARIGENGTVLDVKNYAGPESAFPGAEIVLPMADGGCGVVGGPREEPRLARLDACGDIRWNATVPYLPSEFRGLRETGDGGLELLAEEIVNNSVIHGPDGTMHAVVYGPDGSVLRETRFAIPPGCPITGAPDRGYVVAALEKNAEGDLSYCSPFDRPSPLHLIKFSEAGTLEWDRIVGSRPDMYRVVMIDAVGDDGSVVVGERERARSILDYLPG